MMAGILLVLTKPSSYLSFVSSREEEIKGFLLVVGGYSSRLLGLMKMKLIFKLPRPWVQLCDTL